MALSRMQIDAFREDGIVYPIRGLEPDGARALIPAQKDLEARLRAGWNLPQYPKVHLVARWAHGLVTRPSIVDAVASILGPDVLCWCATFFAKPPHDPGYVGWHQDATYWGLDPTEKVVTVWLGLTESTPENGCMRYVPGSHREGLRPHAQRFDDANLLQSGQFVEVAAEDAAADVVLDAGEFSIHHARTLHGSLPNASDRPRIGLSVNYVAAGVRQVSGPDSATLVHGRDHGNFRLEPPPDEDFSQAAVAAWLDALEYPSGLGRSAKRAVAAG